jgi:polyphosphate kinase 2 (PPK2 family)
MRRQVVSFKQPSSEDLDNDPLWRINAALPEPAASASSNRSRYGEFVALRVHPEWFEKQKQPPRPRRNAVLEGPLEDIKAYEHLARSGTKIVKFFLHVLKSERKRRFLARLNTPGKEWRP